MFEFGFPNDTVPKRLHLSSQEDGRKLNSFFSKILKAVLSSCVILLKFRVLGVNLEQLAILVFAPQ